MRKQKLRPDGSDLLVALGRLGAFYTERAFVSHLGRAQVRSRDKAAGLRVPSQRLQDLLRKELWVGLSRAWIGRGSPLGLATE